MRLRYVGVENFRAFRRAEIRFPGTGLVLVAGPNNAGKTALLSALDTLAGDNGDVSSLRHAGAQGPARLGAVFDLDEADRVSILESARGGQDLLRAGVLASLEFIFEQWDNQPLVLREVRGSWPDLDPQPLVVMRPDPARGIDQYAYQIIHAFQPGDTQGARAGAALEVADQQHHLLKVTGVFTTGPNGLDGFLADPSGWPPLMAVLSAWRSRFYHFRALRPGTPQRVQGIASPDRLDPTGSNLAGVLHFLATDRRPVFERVRALIAQVVPGIGVMEVRTGGAGMRVEFDTSAGALNLKDLGTGVEQLLMTVVVGLTEEPPFTLLIEEPETNLNPAAQRALLGWLQDWASDRLIVAATHSTVMLDWSPAGDRLWLVTREHDVSHVEAVSADPLSLLDALGVRLSDILSADRVLVVEGTSDEDILQVWFPEVLRHSRVAVLRGRGGDNARHADQFAEWLAGTGRAGLRRVLYLRDRDELAPEVLQRLTGSPSVHVLQRREIENYLLDPAAIAAVLRPLVPPGTPAPDAPAIAQALDDAAGNLRRKVVINRVAQQVTPPRSLMDTTLRKQLAADGVELDKFKQIVTERLMTPPELEAQVTTAWNEGEADVATCTGEALLKIAPGEEVLNTVFLQYVGRRYDKRVHGTQIAATMNPPMELDDLFEAFMAD